MISLNHHPISSLRHTIAAHVIGWSVFILFELFFLSAFHNHFESWYIYVVFYTLNLLLFYGQLTLMSARIRPLKLSTVIRVVGFIGLLAVYLAFKLLADRYLEQPHRSLATQLHVWRLYLLPAIYRGGYFIMLAVFYWTASHLAENRRKLTEARSAYLQQQINPHLIFNSLNFIYNSVYQQSPGAARQVYLLSEIMRFSLSETGADHKIPLSAELEQLGNLIEINRKRFDHPLHLNADMDISTTGYRIIPLILMTLTENLFKHGNLSKIGSGATLRITVNDDRVLTYYCRNLKKAKSSHAPLQSIGLQNTRVRLDLAYASRYVLHILDEEDYFELTLTLPV